MTSCNNLPRTPRIAFSFMRKKLALIPGLWNVESDCGVNALVPLRRVTHRAVSGPARDQSIERRG